MQLVAYKKNRPKGLKNAVNHSASALSRLWLNLHNDERLKMHPMRSMCNLQIKNIAMQISRGFHGFLKMADECWCALLCRLAFPTSNRIDLVCCFANHGFEHACICCRGRPYMPRNHI